MANLKAVVARTKLKKLLMPLPTWPIVFGAVPLESFVAGMKSSVDSGRAKISTVAQATVAPKAAPLVKAKANVAAKPAVVLQFTTQVKAKAKAAAKFAAKAAAKGNPSSC